MPTVVTFPRLIREPAGLVEANLVYGLAQEQSYNSEFRSLQTQLPYRPEDLRCKLLADSGPRRGIPAVVRAYPYLVAMQRIFSSHFCILSLSHPPTSPKSP
jgi:hypothetical protein